MGGKYLGLEASEEGGPDPSWPQPPGNDHTGPGPGWGGGPSTSPPDLSGYHPGITHQPTPDPPTPYEKAKANWERAQKKKKMEDMARWYYGALPDEQGAVPAPREVNYTPKPGEEKVNFRCGGVLVFGYPGECTDFVGQLSTRRALEALARGWWWRFPRWAEDKWDDAMRAIWDTAHHEVFNDGKGEECKNECDGWAVAICTADIGMGLYLCRTHNPACAAALAQTPELKDMGVGVVSIGVCYARTDRRCVKNQCGSD